MLVIKRVLIGLGVLFLALIVLVWSLGETASAFRKEQEPIAKSFVTELSRHWSITDLPSDRLTDPFRQQMLSIQGQQVLHQFKQLGVLTAARDFGLYNYSTGLRGLSGVVTFKATFENGDATVYVTVIKKDNKTQISGISVANAHLSPAQRRTDT